MNKAEYIERYGIDAYNNYKARKNEECKERYKNDLDFRDKQKAYHKVRNTNNTEYREYQKGYQKEYRKKDLNSDGKTKDSIRFQSNKILFKQRKHTKLKDYQIHHAFGYNDPSKFIYIPKSLHYKIHQYLRDNNIDADSNHYDYIKHMINECEEYTYISV